MPSEIHKNLYQQLQEVNEQVKTVLDKNDYEALPVLLKRQDTILLKLESLGPCKDPGLMSLLIATRDQTNATMAALQSRRDDLAGQLRTAGTKRKLVRAYGK